MQFAVVDFATAAAASAEAASAAAAVTQTWSDRDRLDQDCSATMKVYYLKCDNVLLMIGKCCFLKSSADNLYPQVEASAMRMHGLEPNGVEWGAGINTPLNLCTPRAAQVA